MAKKVNYEISRRFLDANEEPTQQLKPIEGYEKKLLVSLEESVKYIKDLVNSEQMADSQGSIQIKQLVGDEHIKKLANDLDRNIWLAKLSSNESKDNLTQDESAAIRLYTMQWQNSDSSLYTVLNKILRSENRDILKPWFSYLKLILTALFKLPSKKGIIWRGIRGTVSNEYQEYKIWWGFSSCTESEVVRDRFLGNSGQRTIFKINCINGKAIRHHSAFADEEEVLLMPGTYLRVIDKITSADGLCTIHLQETTAPYELLKPPFSSQVDLGNSILQILDSNLKLNEKIGSGGFGTVYRATWLINDDVVAVKKILPIHLNKETEQTFFNELSVLNRIRYHHIVTYYGACLEKGKYALVMEYTSLESLHKMLHQQKVETSWPERLSIAFQAAKGINFLHQCQPQILHRDIKSLNFLLEKHNEGYSVKICDFGLAETRNEITRQTKGNTIMAFTLPWSAPEILCSKPYTDKSDIYSLSIVYWELATYKKPYEDHHNDNIRAFVIAGERLEIPDTTPLNFRTIIKQCWAHNPGDRPSSSRLIEIIKDCSQKQSESHTSPFL